MLQGAKGGVLGSQNWDSKLLKKQRERGEGKYFRMPTKKEKNKNRKQEKVRFKVSELHYSSPPQSEEWMNN